MTVVGVNIERLNLAPVYKATFSQPDQREQQQPKVMYDYDLARLMADSGKKLLSCHQLPQPQAGDGRLKWVQKDDKWWGWISS